MAKHKVKISIECDNAAFDGLGLYSEVSRILLEIGNTAKTYIPNERILKDINGNKVGKFTFNSRLNL